MSSLIGITELQGCQLTSSSLKPAICSSLSTPPSKMNISESSHGPCGDTQSTHNNPPTGTSFVVYLYRRQSCNIHSERHLPF